MFRPKTVNTTLMPSLTINKKNSAKATSAYFAENKQNYETQKVLHLTPSASEILGFWFQAWPTRPQNYPAWGL